MLRESKKVFDLYVNEKQYGEARIAVLNGVYKKLEKWESKLNKNILSMTKDEILNLCVEEDNTKGSERDSIGRERKPINTSIANRSYGAMQTRVEAVNDILEWLQSDIKLSMRDFDSKKVLKKTEEQRYFTKKELQDICDLFQNPQDRYIVYGIFSGIYGKAYSDLLELKVTDVDMGNRTVTTKSGKTIVMDDYLYDVIKDTLDPEWGGYYLKTFSKGNEGTSTVGYALNTKSKYVLRPKPYSKNRDGYDPMKLNGVQTRLKKLSEYLPKINLSGIDLYRSGLMHQMYMLEKNKNAVWTCASVEKWLKENGISAQPFELYRLYKNKYQS